MEGKMSFWPWLSAFLPIVSFLALFQGNPLVAGLPIFGIIALIVGIVMLVKKTNQKWLAIANIVIGAAGTICGLIIVIVGILLINSPPF